jgi:hypothetical protein
MNYAGVLHNGGVFLQNLGRYQEAVDKLNAALAYWPVESTAAVKLTTVLLRPCAKIRRLGGPKLCDVQIRTLMADRSSANNADASIWAPFVLVGEGG